MATKQWKLDNPDAVRRHRRDWYQRNKESEKARALERNRRYRERNVAIAREAKSSPCIDCGQFYPYYVMHFDHLGDDKDRDIKTMVWHPVSEAKLRAEIAKCEPVCANCHAERTHQRRVGAGTTEDEGV